MTGEKNEPMSAVYRHTRKKRKASSGIRCGARLLASAKKEGGGLTPPP
jgi:hypothetical protein